MWPFELLKNLAQAENNLHGTSSMERAKYIYNNQGLKGFYRGILPGSKSIFLRNGAAMAVMQQANQLITDLGLRNWMQMKIIILEWFV